MFCPGSAKGHVLLAERCVGTGVIRQDLTYPVSCYDKNTLVAMATESDPAEATERVRALCDDPTSGAAVYGKEVTSRLICQRSIVRWSR